MGRKSSAKREVKTARQPQPSPKKTIPGSLWTWPAVGFASGILYSFAGNAQSARDFALAAVLYLIATVLLLLKFITWEGIKGHRHKSSLISIFVVVACLVLGGLVYWAFSDAQQVRIVLPKDAEPQSSRQPSPTPSPVPTPSTPDKATNMLQRQIAELIQNQNIDNQELCNHTRGMTATLRDQAKVFGAMVPMLRREMADIQKRLDANPKDPALIAEYNNTVSDGMKRMGNATKKFSYIFLVTEKPGFDYLRETYSAKLHEDLKMPQDYEDSKIVVGGVSMSVRPELFTETADYFDNLASRLCHDGRKARRQP